MTGWILRRATIDDAQALGACIDDAYADYAKRIRDLPAVSAGIDEDIKNNLVWVAESGAKIVGGLVLVAHSDHGVLANLAVHSQCSGRGIGKALIHLAEAECRTRGLSELRLSTHVDMPANAQLYEHLGWHLTSRSGNKINMTKMLVVG